MSIHTEWVQFSEQEHDYKLYTSRPAHAKTPLPVVLVIQEIWGTDDHILELTDRFAKAGYLAVTPDLYAVNGERPSVFAENRIEQVKAFLDTVPPTVWSDPAARDAEMDKLPAGKREDVKATFAELFGGLARMPKHLETLKAAVHFLKDYEYSKGQKVASVGYCMGGALSALLASAEPELAGAVIYYGNLPGKEQIETIQCPVTGFFGGWDKRITSQVPGFSQLMAEAGKSFTSEIYEGAHHAFFNDSRASYHVEAARDAWVKTLSFFKKVLTEN
ncbi:dienelactone hydrolase family protein [Aneurinibacillus sp. Ricciae_BoGa-3]|uniref:dienelactone hydrolase family protein n=1 Tax=Aneurinibacillus sp. Ricciae_BoGa-3 TaxID=3022697 RepID=UPI002341AA17|nr:dienelactone hydrolase family protein [Aneurinibacillus sp. Ricciae_BoGa-3]WCK56584.1 dienelactone hydrolase family protein [Aneurinibacillus sp. Ricciae_BoGa-3]